MGSGNRDLGPRALAVESLRLERLAGVLGVASCGRCPGGSRGCARGVGAFGVLDSQVPPWNRRDVGDLGRARTSGPARPGRALRPRGSDVGDVHLLRCGPGPTPGDAAKRQFHHAGDSHCGPASSDPNKPLEPDMPATVDHDALESAAANAVRRSSTFTAADGSRSPVRTELVAAAIELVRRARPDCRRDPRSESVGRPDRLRSDCERSRRLP